jgi:ATP-binding cassette subfamily A (ABC1) protein 3
MEECEALCTRLAIMVDGQFKCIGSPQTVKSTYGAGFSLLVRLDSEKGCDAVKSKVLNAFPASVVKEHHAHQLNFELKKQYGQTWSSLFDTMEKISGELQHMDYTLSQTTLEQVFLEFSRNAVVSEEDNRDYQKNPVDDPTESSLTISL